MVTARGLNNGYGPRRRLFRVRVGWPVMAIALFFLTGCWTSSGPEVVVYTAQDEEFAKPIFDDFTKTTGIAVLPKFDAESTKTAGLANEIVEEAERPRCDVFWNNEILLTLRLARLGLLDVYRPKIAERYPAMYRSKDGLWHGLAARARILLVNTQADAQGPVAAVDRRSDRRQMERADRHGQAAVRHHGHPCGLPVRGLGRREGPRVLRQA